MDYMGYLMYYSALILWFDHFLDFWAEICQIFRWFFGKFKKIKKDILKLTDFESEETGGFLRCQIKYSKSLSWAENSNFSPKTVNNLFKFSAKGSDLEYLIWQHKNSPASSDLKPPLSSVQIWGILFLIA